MRIGPNIVRRENMKSLRKYMIALGFVGLWAVFSYAYLGVEDGSSGLSPLGWIQSAFLVPGLFLFRAVKGAYSNADLPLIAALSLCAYAVVVVLVVKSAGLLKRAVFGERRTSKP